MSKVNGLFQDECERRFDELIGLGLSPDDALGEVHRAMGANGDQDAAASLARDENQ